jgi:hypothetical protein
MAHANEHKPAGHDSKPPARFAYLGANLVIDWETPLHREHPQFDLLCKTVRRVLFRGNFPAWLTTEYDKQGKARASAWMNDLIDEGVQNCMFLIAQITSAEVSFLKFVWGDDFTQFMDALPPVDDQFIVKGAKAVTNALDKRQKIIRRPYKLNDDGTRVLDDNKPVRGYEAEMRVAHPTQKRKEGELVDDWTSPVSDAPCGMLGSRITDAFSAEAEMIEYLDGLVRDCRIVAIIGQDGYDFLIDYYGRAPASRPADAEKARVFRLMEKLRKEFDTK